MTTTKAEARAITRDFYRIERMFFRDEVLDLPVVGQVQLTIVHHPNGKAGVGARILSEDATALTSGQLACMALHRQLYPEKYDEKENTDG